MFLKLRFGSSISGKYVCVCVRCFSHVRLFTTPWTVALQGPQSVGFSRQEYWSGLPCPPPGDLPDPRIEPGSSELQVDSLPSELRRKSISGNIKILSSLVSKYCLLI